MKKAQKIVEQSWNPIWDEVYTSHEWGKYPSESLIQFIARNFYKSERGDVRILEVGCGTGANLWYFSREGFQAYGVDGSDVAIKKANDRMISENLTVNLQVADIVNLPFCNSFFDVVIDVECIYCNNSENTKKILEEIKRVLKPEGKFYSRTFSDKMFIGTNIKENIYFEYKDIEVGPLKGKGFVRLSSKDTINDLYGRCFQIESIDYLEYTQYNEKYLINEWVIISRK
jgi:SAM-dependent methyltransferase